MPRELTSCTLALRRCWVALRVLPQSHSAMLPCKPYLPRPGQSEIMLYKPDLFFRDVIKARKAPPRSFYMDINWLGKVWNCFPGHPRVYHYTLASNQLFALREGLAIIAERGLRDSIQAHKACAQHLYKGKAKKMGQLKF